MRSFCLIIITAFLLGACSTQLVIPSETPTFPGGTPMPLNTAGIQQEANQASSTPAGAIMPDPTSSPSPSLVSTITPTPLTYKVAKNDDMYGIAIAFGISPKALMTANPKVNPRAMSIGTILIIPVTPGPGKANGKAAPTSLPQPTPTPSQVLTPRPPDCYPAGDGGVWCFWLVHNGAAQGVEGVTGVIDLTAKGGNSAPLEQTVTTPIDVIQAGAVLPLAGYFPAPVPLSFTASGKISTFLPVPANDTRYLPVVIQDRLVTINLTSAQVSGKLTLPAGSASAKSLRLEVTAFSKDGAVVGLRVWESTDSLAPGSSQAFAMQVDSLGPAINQVTMLAEARP